MSRLKESSNPRITDELRTWKGNSINLNGKQVFDVVDDLHRKFIDVEIEISFKRRPYKGTQSTSTKQFRVVGVRNEDTDDYQPYGRGESPYVVGFA